MRFDLLTGLPQNTQLAISVRPIEGIALYQTIYKSAPAIFTVLLICTSDFAVTRPVAALRRASRRRHRLCAHGSVYSADRAAHCGRSGITIARGHVQGRLSIASSSFGYASVRCAVVRMIEQYSQPLVRAVPGPASPHRLTWNLWGAAVGSDGRGPTPSFFCATASFSSLELSDILCGTTVVSHVFSRGCCSALRPHGLSLA